MRTGIRAWISARASEVTNTIERHLGFVLGVLVIAMLTMAVVFLTRHDTEGELVSEAATASLRNLFLVFVAIIGVPLAIWRSAVAKQQADASDRQAETAERRLKNELYEKGAQMLGNEIPSVRLGGIYSLKGLANQNPEDYRDQVMELLCAFVRDPPDDNAKTPRTGTEDWPNPGASTVRGTLRDDVQTAMNIIARRRDKPEVEYQSEEHWPLDLRGANLEWLEAVARDLAGAILHGANLNRARLANASLEGAKMATGGMKGADIHQADLSGAALSSLDMRNIRASSADFSRCRMNGVEMERAHALEAKFSNSQISGSNFAGALLHRAKLDHCHVTNTDFSSADFWRADLSGAKFGEATRVTTSDAGSTSEKLFCKLTQAQLDKALAHPAKPPLFHPETLDIETGQPLEWRGGCISEDQFSLIHVPQQIVKDGSAKRKQGHYFEWQDMDVRFVPGIVERLKGRELSRRARRATEALENSQATGCTRITFVGKTGSEVDSCGVTRWNDERRIWMLLAYEEGSTATGPNSVPQFFEQNGPDSNAGSERLMNAIDWAADPIVERWAVRNERLPPPRREKR